MQVESDYGRPKDGLGRVVSEHDLQALAVERAGASKGPYAGVKQPSPAMGNQPGPLALLVKVPKLLSLSSVYCKASEKRLTTNSLSCQQWQTLHRC